MGRDLIGLMTAVAAMLAASVATLEVWQVSVDTRSIVALIAGTLAAAMSSLLATSYQLLWTRDVKVTLKFEDVKVPKDISIAHDRVDMEQLVEPWETRPNALLGRDNNLALAQLRMLLEREVRRLAFQYQINARMMPLIKLLDLLLIREVLPPTIKAPLQEVYRATSDAVHGAEVPDDTAHRVVELGEELLSYLKTRSDQQQESK
jgi:hypothetical protein